MDKVMDKVPNHLVEGINIVELCIDSGCTTHSTGFKEYFIEGSLTELSEPIYMQGISGTLKCTQKE